MKKFKILKIVMLSLVMILVGLALMSLRINTKCETNTSTNIVTKIVNNKNFELYRINDNGNFIYVTVSTRSNINVSITK